MKKDNITGENIYIISTIMQNLKNDINHRINKLNKKIKKILTIYSKNKQVIKYNHKKCDLLNFLD